MKQSSLLEIKIWKLLLPGLVIANAAYYLDNIIGWSITLSFFSIVPGYLLLKKMNIELSNVGEKISLSVGLSLMSLIVGGLTLNSFRAFGLERPLTTLPIFIFFDSLILFLVLLNLRQSVRIDFKPRLIGVELRIAFIICTLLPVITVGGAIRLNNGASNILILVLMATIATLFIVLPARQKLRPIYPYAIFMIGLSVLFCNSLRGWYITGHDIHHEFGVFQATYTQGFWQIVNGGDPYNACLSITILPTLFSRITGIPAEYIYKVVFQVLFASFLPTLFYMFRRFASDQKALLGVFVFMTFPTFTNDLPFLNRQEIAFIFVILLLFVNFLKIAYRSKILLTIIFIVSIILSHYSSSYVTLILLLISPFFYFIISRKVENTDSQRFPLMNIRIIIAALLLTFTWNAQITNSTGNLRNTVVDTFINVFGPADEKEAFNYSITQAPTSQKPQLIFQKYASSNPDDNISIVLKEQLPITKLGHAIGKITGIHNAEKANIVFHALLAKVLQLLVILGTVILVFRKRHRAEAHERYLIGLGCASLLALTLFTVLPQLAVDYDVTRLFQQSLMFLWLPSILLAEKIFFFTKKYRSIAASGLFAFLYLNLAGFIPQITGGFPPQLPLNNSGVYYNYFYGHYSDVVGTAWLGNNRDPKEDIKFDSGGIIPSVSFGYGSGLVQSQNPGYLYVDNSDVRRGNFRIIIEGVFIEYKNPAATANRNKIYTNTESDIYLKR